MKKIFSKEKMEGTKLANPKYDDVSYIANKQYIMVEFRSEDFWYATLYLRPYKGDKTLVTAYVPHLEPIADQIYYTEYKSSLRLSPQTLKVLNPSQPNPSMFVSNEKDITGENKYGTFECVHKVVEAKLSPNLINQDFKEYKLLEDAVNEMIDFVNNLLYDLAESLKSDTAIWKSKVNKGKIRKVIELSEKSGFYGNFIGNTKFIEDPDLKDFVEQHKCALVCKQRIYGYGSHILDEDLKENAYMIILLENFDKSFAGSGWLFLVELEYKYGWTPKVNLGELIKGISIIMNDVHKKSWAKIPESAYKVMPIAADTWFYTNYEHEGVMLHRFLANDDRTDYDAGGTLYLVTEPDYVRCRYSLNADRFWTDHNFSTNISSIIDHALTLILEFETYRPIWMKRTGFEILGEIGKFAVNPYKYAINKIFGLNKK